jgi:hypothetical protein
MSKKTSSSVNEDSETKTETVVYMAHRKVATNKTDTFGPCPPSGPMAQI